MKKTLLLGFSLLCTLYLGAQVQVLNIDGTLVNPVGIAVKDNTLFIGQVGSQTLSKIDLSQADPKSVTNISTSLGFVSDMIFDGNTLYIAAGNGNGSIQKLDITDSSNTLTEVVSNLGNLPFGIALDGNILYATVRTHNKIVKIDLSASNPVAEDFIINIPGFAVNDLVIYNNYLYYSVGFSGSPDHNISRADLSLSAPMPEIVQEGIPGPVGLELYGNILIIAVPSGQLGTMNLDSANPTFQTLTAINDPWNLALQNNTLYISQQGPDTISYMGVSSLSSSDIVLENDLAVYPNPASDMIKVSNLTKSVSYKLLDLSGKSIFSNVLEVDGEINIKSLSKGLYILQLEGHSKPYKVVKE